MQQNVYLVPDKKAELPSTDILLCIKPHSTEYGNRIVDVGIKGELLRGVSYYAKDEYYQRQQIHITDDTLVDVGDWWFNPETKDVGLCTLVNKSIRGTKKIILSTDPFLIERGIQRIDVSFIENYITHHNNNRTIINVWIGTSRDMYEIYGVPRFEPSVKLIIGDSKPIDPIETAAFNALPNNPEEAFFNHSDSDIWVSGYKEGATSEVAREYWYEQFKNI